jgi:hypothetical protein
MVDRHPAAAAAVHLLWPLIAAVMAVAALVGLYLGLVTWAQGFGHATDLLWGDRYFVAAIAAGFGLQVGLFVHLRRLLSLQARRIGDCGTAHRHGHLDSGRAPVARTYVTDALGPGAVGRGDLSG